MNLIVMLTHHDQTVKEAAQVFESCKELPVQHWGFKNIGVPKEEMVRLAALMKEAGKTTYLEVVTFDEPDCLAAARLAVDCGIDCLMGTMYYPSVHKLLKENGLKYYPFCGKVWDNPTKLGHTYEDVIDSALELQRLGVEGTDILAYRFVGDAEELLRRFFQKTGNFSVVVAGSIDSHARMDFMKELNPYGITMGSALFDKKFVPDGSFADNLAHVAEYMKKR